MSDGGYTGAMDVWALGCIFGELLQRQQQHALTPHLTVSPLFRFDDDPVSRAGFRRDVHQVDVERCRERRRRRRRRGHAGRDVQARESGEGSAEPLFRRRRHSLVARRPRGSSERWRAYLRGIRGRPGSSRVSSPGATTRVAICCFACSRSTRSDARRPTKFWRTSISSQTRGRHEVPNRVPTESRRDRGLGPRPWTPTRGYGRWISRARRWRRSRWSSPRRRRPAERSRGRVDRGAWREGFEELFRRECDRSTRSGAKDESPPPPASPASLARWESAFDHAPREKRLRRVALVAQRDLPGRLHDVFPLFFRGAQRPLAYDGGDRVRSRRMRGRPRGHRVAVPRRRSGHDGVYGQGGVA